MTEFLTYGCEQPTKLVFLYNSGMEKQGKFGPFYSFGVNGDRGDGYLPAIGCDTKLGRKLKSMEPLKGKEIILEKRAILRDGKASAEWFINGQPIDPPPTKEEVGQVLQKTQEIATPDEWKEINRKLDNIIDLLSKKVDLDEVPF